MEITALVGGHLGQGSLADPPRTTSRTIQESLRDLSDKLIQEGVDRMVERNPEQWMKDRKAFEKVKLEVEYVKPRKRTCCANHKVLRS